MTEHRCAVSMRTRGPLRIVLVDDHELLRRGLHLLLDQEEDIDVVGEAWDGLVAVRVVGDCVPDVVLLDFGMPRWDGVDTCRVIKNVAPSTKVIMLTTDEEPAYIDRAVQAGASGHVRKDAPIDDLCRIVRKIADIPLDTQVAD